jgi:uncharacterized protein YoaH (UPF0181 family)
MELIHQRLDQVRIQKMMSSGLTGGNLYSNLASQLVSQGVINLNQTFRADGFGKIYF